MKLQDQVCTLEQAKRLKELGVEQVGAIFYHSHIWNVSWQIRQARFADESFPYFAAFTVAELGLMLPKEFQYKGTKCYIQIWLQNAAGFSACINKIDWFDGQEIHPEIARHTNFKSEAELRASMLIYMLETNLITAAEVNERLAQ